jgi:hypothetical protein
MNRKNLLSIGPVLAGAVVLAALSRPERVRADDASSAAEKRERCATRLSVAILGKSPTPELVAAPNPQDSVPSLLGSADFVERFARFVNAEFNPEPGETIPDDASYTLAKYVLTNDKPWKDMFVGQYDVTDVVTADPNGLGYFRSRPWMVRYAGNELAGYRLVSAYRILQNTTGLVLTATTNVEGVDLSTSGRQAPACAGCHYQKWYALDKVARVLSKRTGPANNPTFTPPTEGPQQILGGQTINNDKELVEGLVASEDFKFNVCRIAFKYLYGRAETTCEGAVFDKCVDAFGADGKMTSALSAVARDASYCQ